ncbi:MAG: ATP-binding cassette domain-containing protein [Bryobacterales bacterium]|nr:ATP-binding cassette domain-containing protein [Bryobacterales bacterium]
MLDGISLELETGETISVLGRSGTGKSVLLKIMIGLQQPDSGSVMMLGQEIGKLDPRQLAEVRKNIGFLFQHSALYDSMTILENVEFPIARHTERSEEDRKARARELLKSVGMEDAGDKLPSQVSGGMQKRVGLARALALDPKIVLFDEPTAGLDPITAGEIADLIVDLKKTRKMAAVVVTHDLRTAKRFSDRMILIEGGTIRAEGRLDDLKANKDEFVNRFVRGAE